MPRLVRRKVLGDLDFGYRVQEFECPRGVSAARILDRYRTRAGIMPLTKTASTAHMRDELATFDLEPGEEECVSRGASPRA